MCFIVHLCFHLKLNFISWCPHQASLIPLSEKVCRRLTDGQKFLQIQTLAEKNAHAHFFPVSATFLCAATFINEAPGHLLIPLCCMPQTPAPIPRGKSTPFCSVAYFCSFYYTNVGDTPEANAPMKRHFSSEQPPHCPHQKHIYPHRSTSSSARLCVCVCVCVGLC